MTQFPQLSRRSAAESFPISDKCLVVDQPSIIVLTLHGTVEDCGQFFKVISGPPSKGTIAYALRNSTEDLDNTIYLEQTKSTDDAFSCIIHIDEYLFGGGFPDTSFDNFLARFRRQCQFLAVSVDIISECCSYLSTSCDSSFHGSILSARSYSSAGEHIFPNTFDKLYEKAVFPMAGHTSALQDAANSLWGSLFHLLQCSSSRSIEASETGIMASTEHIQNVINYIDTHFPGSRPHWQVSDYVPSGTVAVDAAQKVIHNVELQTPPLDGFLDDIAWHPAFLTKYDLVFYIVAVWGLAYCNGLAPPGISCSISAALAETLYDYQARDHKTRSLNLQRMSAFTHKENRDELFKRAPLSCFWGEYGGMINMSGVALAETVEAAGMVIKQQQPFTTVSNAVVMRSHDFGAYGQLETLAVLSNGSPLWDDWEAMARFAALVHDFGDAHNDLPNGDPATSFAGLSVEAVGAMRDHLGQEIIPAFLKNAAAALLASSWYPAAEVGVVALACAGSLRHGCFSDLPTMPRFGNPTTHFVFDGDSRPASSSFRLLLNKNDKHLCALDDSRPVTRIWLLEQWEAFFHGDMGAMGARLFSHEHDYVAWGELGIHLLTMYYDRDSAFLETSCFAYTAALLLLFCA